MIDASTIDNMSTVTNRGKTTDAATKSLGSSMDQFLKLLTTQLKNQDPTAPADVNQMTQQIASLSQVEQAITTNKKLDSLLTAYGATQYNSVVGYIGKQIEAPGDVSALMDGKAQMALYMGKEAHTNTVTITNEAGATVYTGPAPTAAGRSVFTWDGKNNAGIAQPEGTYTMKFAAKDTAGEPIGAASYIVGVVTSIDSAEGNVYASIGDISVLLSKITSIAQPKITATNS